MIDLGYDFFVIFWAEDDLDHVLEGGPWFVGGCYLAVQRWKPDFHPAFARISTMAVWVRFVDLPLEYYDKEALMALAVRVGKPIRVDSITLAQSRGRFASVWRLI